MKSWLKQIIGITQLENRIKHLEEEASYLWRELRIKQDSIEKLTTHINYKSRAIDRTLKELNKFVAVDADVGYGKRGNNTIIITGVLRGKAYVKFYDLGDGEFHNMVDQLRDMSKHQYIRNIDSPMYDFKGSFDI